VPSENYDNFPNTVLESFAFRKPVIATNLGSLRETIIHEETGIVVSSAGLFRPQGEGQFSFTKPGPLQANMVIMPIINYRMIWK
jgi:hypothetical protein